MTGKYHQFFEISNRVNGGRNIAIVKDGCFEPLLQTIVSDTEIDLQSRVALVLLLSGGLRTQELLSLKKDCLEITPEGIYFRSNVLKKRYKKDRLVRVYPGAELLVKEYVSTKIGSKMFTFSHSTLARLTKDLFPSEACLHSLRHSHISWLLFTKNLTIPMCAKLVDVSSGIVDRYAHLNQKRVLQGLYA